MKRLLHAPRHPPAAGRSLGLAALAACGGDDDAPAARRPPRRRSFKLDDHEDRGRRRAPSAASAPTRSVTGTFTGEVDPKDAKNAIIQDLALAPLNANGKVEYTSDFVLLKPKDMSKASGVLRYDAPNRGNIVGTSIRTSRSRGYVFLTLGLAGRRARGRRQGSR